MILRNQNNRYIYYIGTEDNPGPLSELLPNVESIKSTIYSSHKVDVPILEISVEKEDQKCIIRLILDEKIISKIHRWFVKEAVLVDVPTKRKKEAIENLLPLLERDAKKVQLPERHGWQEDLDGDFVFVCPESLSYLEVLKDAI